MSGKLDRINLAFGYLSSTLEDSEIEEIKNLFVLSALGYITTHPELVVPDSQNDDNDTMEWSEYVKTVFIED